MDLDGPLEEVLVLNLLNVAAREEMAPCFGTGAAEGACRANIVHPLQELVIGG